MTDRPRDSKLEGMNTGKIISRILSGDKDAYREIVVKYTPLVRTYLWGRLSDRQVIDVRLIQDIDISSMRGSLDYTNEP